MEFEASENSETQSLDSQSISAEVIIPNHEVSAIQDNENQDIAEQQNDEPLLLPYEPQIIDFAIALYPYIPNDPVIEMALDPGDQIQVFERDKSGWWDGHNVNNGTRGLFPRSFVHVLHPDDMPDAPRLSDTIIARFRSKSPVKRAENANHSKKNRTYKRGSVSSHSRSPSASKGHSRKGSKQKNAAIQSTSGFATGTEAGIDNEFDPLLLSPTVQSQQASNVVIQTTSGFSTGTEAGIDNESDLIFSPTDQSHQASKKKNVVIQTTSEFAMGTEIGIDQQSELLLSPTVQNHRANKVDLGAPIPASGAKIPSTETKDDECPTRFAFYGRNMCQLNGIALFIVAVGSLLTAYLALNPWKKKAEVPFTNLHLVVFTYASLLGLTVFLAESMSKYKLPGKVPVRAIVYILVSIPLFTTTFTTFNGVIFLISSIFHYLGTVKKEVILPNTKTPGTRPNEPKTKVTKKLSAIFSFRWLQQRLKAGKMRKDCFTLLFGMTVAGMYALGFVKYWPRVQPGMKLYKFTPIVPFAKGFGFALDFTCAVIVLPVCRTFIRILYDYSTQDNSFGSRTLRSILWLFPLDRSLHFHEKTGWLILVLAFGHSAAHLINAGIRWNTVVAHFGWAPLLTGFVLWVVMFFMYPAVRPNVKRGQFEIFWYSHQLFALFFGLLLLHGKNWWTPNYWKAFLVPGLIYIFERIYREYSAYQTVSIISITNMKDNVLSIEFSRSAFPRGYLEGQYCFINCPQLSWGQWHPFTISSAPDDPTVTLHIKIQGKHSWTRQLLDYFTFMGPLNASYFEMADSGPNGIEVGKTVGPLGERMLRLYGPLSAPTQHMPEYQVDIIAGSGIGVTPVSATMQQMVFYRWKYNIGESYPDHAYFVWICAHSELSTFRWMVRTVKECHDEVFDQRFKNANAMRNKTFEVHIFVTSVPKDQKKETVEVDDDIGFWGRPRKATGRVSKAPEKFSEIEIYETMLCPPKKEPAQLGDIRIYNGRPDWDILFSRVADRHVACKTGVAFCGNPRIGDDLKAKCTQYTQPKLQQYFILHKENF